MEDTAHAVPLSRPLAPPLTPNSRFYPQPLHPLNPLHPLAPQVQGEGFLRLRVDGGGCSGFQYKFLVDQDALAEDDVVFERCETRNPKLESFDLSLSLASPLPRKRSTANPEPNTRSGAKLVIDETSLDLVRGSTVDFVEEMISSSFQVSGFGFGFGVPVSSLHFAGCGFLGGVVRVSGLRTRTHNPFRTRHNVLVFLCEA
jgi:Fe-S cluster assembly iron-binding protein IscA